MAEFTNQVTYQVDAREEFRATPDFAGNRDENLTRDAYQRLCGWKREYVHAHDNGMEMLALGALSFRVEKRVSKFDPAVEAAEAEVAT